MAGNARNARIVDEAVRAAALLLDHVRNRYGTPEAPRLHHAPVWPETPHTQHNTQHSERAADGAIRYAERARWAAPLAPVTRAGLRVDAAASMRATIEGRGDGVAFADLPRQRPFSDLEMILNIPAGAGHDLLQGYGRGRDESFSAAVTREVMRRIMTETYTPGAGKYVYDSIQATTFHDTLKTQDYYGRPVPVAVGDLILLNEKARRTVSTSRSRFSRNPTRSGCGRSSRRSAGGPASICTPPRCRCISRPSRTIPCCGRPS
ncbi:hypothetical protein GCM10023191_053330 [Actinoallomurus oryzae]|uniref:Uncharacterized protein n=1 Tax=Actinoallomurus oryzae TaxID=502180 RepID=A0ABP8QEM3_9ACTN